MQNKPSFPHQHTFLSFAHLVSGFFVFAAGDRYLCWQWLDECERKKFCLSITKLSESCRNNKQKKRNRSLWLFMLLYISFFSHLLLAGKCKCKSCTRSEVVWAIFSLCGCRSAIQILDKAFDEAWWVWWAVCDGNFTMVASKGLWSIWVSFRLIKKYYSDNALSISSLIEAFNKCLLHVIFILKKPVQL